MLAAGEELAEAASQALGVDMQFEDISEYVYLHSQNLALTTWKPAYMSHNCADDILGPRQSGSCTLRHRRMLPKFSICSSTTPWLERARRTTSPPVPSTILLASIHRSRSTSSKCMPLNSNQSMRVRRERPMASSMVENLRCVELKAYTRQLA